MIGEVCSHYGWTDEHVLAMPLRRFFTMAEQARIQRARRLMDQAQIAAIGIQNVQYFNDLMAALTEEAKGKRTPRQVEDQDAEPQSLDGGDAKHAVMSLFR